MRFSLLVLPLLAVLAAGTAKAGPLESEVDPVKEPSLEYMLALEKLGGKSFFLEHFDSKGRLVNRDQTTYAGAKILSPTKREINGQVYVLRGLDDCPVAKIQSPNGDVQACLPAAQDYADRQYNRFARTVLCKTFVIDKNWSGPVPVSCFTLLGKTLKESGVNNDDDSMVYMRVAAIGHDAKGQLLRPDLVATQKQGEEMYSAAQ